VLKSNAAEQSVHLTGGILRHFQAFSTPKQNPALEVLSTPAHPQVTQTVGRFLSETKSEASMTTRLPEVHFSSFLYATFLAHLCVIIPFIGGVLLFKIMDFKPLFLILAILALPAIPSSAAFAWLIAKGSNWEKTSIAFAVTCGFPMRMYGIFFGGLLGFHFFNLIGGIVGVILFYLLAFFSTAPFGKFISSKVMREVVS